jgi:predicted lipid carrier protein YhbT
LDDYLYELVKKHRPDLLQESFLQTDSGRPSKPKVMAYLYQHGETQVMDIVRLVALTKGHKPIANVHDAIFFKRRLGVDFKTEIEMQMREQTGNPYWHLTPKQLERYKPRSLNAAAEESEHKKRIEQEEALAKGYKSVFPNILIG